MSNLTLVILITSKKDKKYFSLIFRIFALKCPRQILNFCQQQPKSRSQRLTLLFFNILLVYCFCRMFNIVNGWQRVNWQQKATRWQMRATKQKFKISEPCSSYRRAALAMAMVSVSLIYICRFSRFALGQQPCLNSA